MDRPINRRHAKRAAVGFTTAGVLASAAMISVPTANAACASFFGFGSSGQCTSTFGSVAFAAGENAEAHADGLFGAAITLGSFSSASTVSGALFNLAVTLGESNLTSAGGIGSLAFVYNSINQAVFAGSGPAADGNILNVAVSLASPEATETRASGIANFSSNFLGSGRVAGNGVGLFTANTLGIGADLSNNGVLNVITNVLGTNTVMSNSGGNGGIANIAFNFLGIDNLITTQGALAIAGTVSSTEQTVSQNGPGLNVRFNRQSAVTTAATRLGAAAAKADTVAAQAGTRSTRAGALPSRNRSIR